MIKHSLWYHEIPRGHGKFPPRSSNFPQSALEFLLSHPNSYQSDLIANLKHAQNADMEDLFVDFIEEISEYLKDIILG